MADETRVFQYTLRLRYPNGRTFTHVTESERLLDVGAELEAFGRIWRIADKVRPARLEDAAKPGPDVFTCDPVRDPRLPRRLVRR